MKPVNFLGILFCTANLLAGTYAEKGMYIETDLVIGFGDTRDAAIKDALSAMPKGFKAAKSVNSAAIQCADKTVWNEKNECGSHKVRYVLPVSKFEYPKAAIVQAIIDHPMLQPYLHPESPGRVPLVISDNLIGSDVKLTKFGQKVRIVSEGKQKRAYLKFTAFDCKNENYCNIAFDYPIEGVSGSTGVAINPDGKLQLEKTDISEH